MSWQQRATFNLFAAGWTIAALFFWSWWLGHFENRWGYWISTALLGWLHFLPVYFLFFARRMVKPNPDLPIPRSWRVAMVVTKAPSEPWEVVRTTLEAMLAQAHPHDTWLADEEPSQETLEWCERHGVRVSTRRGVAAYHRTTWPRRTRCKEGNLAYFYDHYGYDRYDVVVQLDADHVPAAGYLEHMIRPFIDEDVGYVSAPSICDANAATHWSVRCRLYAESTMHGILQAGYSNGWAPLCIGSHYAVRTKALKQIGGLGPELAEDHSTTLMMNGHGWRGVHAFDAEAHGDGPARFTDLATQELQWSRSLIVLLMTLMPRYFSQLRPRLRFQFLFSQLWYPLFALSMVFGLSLPIIALVSRTPIVSVSYAGFLLHALPATAVLIGMVAWFRRGGWLRSKESPVLSWHVVIFHITRWPWVLLGVGGGILGTLRRKTFDFKVTPKGGTATATVPFRVVTPYLVIVALHITTVFAISDPQDAQGYYFFALSNLLLYMGAFLVIIAAPLRRYFRGGGDTRGFLPQVIIGVVALVLVGGAFQLRGGSALQGILWDVPWGISPTAPVQVEATFGVYDFYETFEDSENIAIEHDFVGWNELSPEKLRAFVVQAHDRDRWPMITVEPFPIAPLGADTLLEDVARGDYDESISSICSTFESTGLPGFIRWGHEMEQVTGRYPWARTEGERYIEAYRHVVMTCRAELADSDLYFVWSPAGNKELSTYWPGGDYVDYVGLSVFAFDEWERANIGRIRSFEEIFGERYERVKGYNKPVLIAELGVNGPQRHQARWIESMYQVANSYPLLKNIVYFNAPDTPGAWGDEYSTPDWRIPPEWFETE